jgi:helicase MOV-10
MTKKNQKIQKKSKQKKVEKSYFHPFFFVFSRFFSNMKFNIRFTINRFPLRNMHRAVEAMSHAHQMKRLIFPQIDQVELDQLELERVNPHQQVAFFDSQIGSNAEQSRAVKNIVSGGIPGIPYIIFGPPGTGKTVTISEAIKQIWKSKPNSHILAAAPSNSAADLLAVNLKKQVPNSQILRFYAPSRLEKLVSKPV